MLHAGSLEFIWQWVPDRRTSDRKSPTAGRAEYLGDCYV